MNKVLKITFLFLIIFNILLLIIIRDKKKNTIKNIERYQVNLNSEKIKNFKDSLPEEKDILNLISQITKLGNNLNLIVPGIHYLPLKTSNYGYKNLVFALTVTGEYKNIRQFIYNIETIRKLIYIESLTLRKSTLEKDILTIELQVSTYFK
ncbi:MAG: type 4a pilus biogenesis protein PilO [Candidatus Firestonebacteria bacterium]